MEKQYNIPPTFLECWSGEKKLVKNYANKYHIQATILDVLLNNEELKLRELEDLVFSKQYATLEIQYNMPVVHFQLFLRELWLLKMVKARVDGQEGDISELFKTAKDKIGFVKKVYISLTDVGIIAIKNQTFQSNALSALTARRVRRLSTISVIIALLGLTISIINAICN